MQLSGFVVSIILTLWTLAIHIFADYPLIQLYPFFVRTNIPTLKSTNLLPASCIIEEININKKVIPQRKELFYVSNKYRETCRDLVKPKMLELYKDINKIEAQILCLRNMYTTYAGVAANNENAFHPVKKLWFYDDTGGNVTGSYETVISLGHSNCISYSHFFQDTIAPLMLIPKDVWEKAYIVGYGIPQVVTETFQLLGFENRIIKLRMKQWIFAQKLYIAINPRPYISHYGTAFLNLSKILRSYFKTEDIIPTEYVFMNRNSKMRNIANMEEIFNAVKQNFPQIPWKIKQDDYGTLKESSSGWAIIKFIFTPTGSNVIRCLFMKEKTACILAMGQFYDASVMKQLGTLEIYTCVFIVNRMDHWNSTPNIVDIPEILGLFRAAIHHLENGTWPGVSDQTHTFIA